MKSVKVLGSESADFSETYTLIETVARKYRIVISIEKILKRADIISYGVMCLPGVIINGKVMHFGTVPSTEMVTRWLSE